MGQETTFSSYGAAVANGTDGWRANQRAADAFPDDLYPAARPPSPGDDGEATKYVTFGCVEYSPRE